MTNKSEQAIEKKLDIIIDLMQQLVALELSRKGVPQGEIGKHLHVAKSTVVKMLKGVKKNDP
jgi:DNA-binding MarR family transcriptional regulator